MVPGELEQGFEPHDHSFESVLRNLCRSRRSTLWAAAAVLVTPLTLVACAPGEESPAGQDEDSGASDLVLTDSTLYPGAYALPSESVGWTSEQARVVAAWEDELASACMAEKGVPMPASNVPEGTVWTQPTNEYGVVDLEWVSQYGYVDEWSVASAGQEEPSNDDAGPMEQIVPQATIDAWEGVEPEVEVSDESGRIIGRYRPDGCLYAPVVALGPQDFYLSDDLREQVETISNEAAASVEQSSAFMDGESAWRDCMAESGYIVDSVYLPGGAAVSDPSEQTAESIAQAVADVECKNSTGFLREWSRLRAQEEWLRFQEQPGLLEGLAELRGKQYDYVAANS